MYSRLQKFISSLLIFSLLFSFTFRFSFFGFIWSKVLAKDNKIYSLVSIIVDEEIYSDIKTEVETYAKDIQNTLEETRVIILPTPKDASSFQIASLNESLYFDWYKSLSSVDFESKLVWTVLIWDIPIPVVYNWSNSSKTILPFTDFENKSYIYNNSKGKYEYSDYNLDWIKPEIWHWVINPNTWDKDIDIQKIKDYFSKNHDFYLWTWNFQISQGIINWNREEWILDNYEPFVFYYDQFREQDAASFQKYNWYEMYLENKEDLIYKRYSKELAEKLKDQILWTQDNQLRDLITKIDPGFDTSVLSSWPDLEKNFDVHTRYITDSVVKNFLEIFNEATISEIRDDVYNSGRYSLSWWRANVDLIPVIISVLDLVSDEVIHSVNNDLEMKIDEIVKNWLSRKLAVPEWIDVIWDWRQQFEDLEAPFEWTYIRNCSSKYINFFNWIQTKDLKTALDCSLYRWNNDGWTLVQANRGYNLKNAQDDALLCNNWKSSWYWWWNSPLNLDYDAISNLEFILKEHDVNKSIVPVFDIVWAKKETDSSKVPSPYDCYNSNYILVEKESSEFWDEFDLCPTVFRAPINWESPIWFSCSTENKNFDFNRSFEDLYKNPVPSDTCEYHNLVLDWSVVSAMSLNLCEEIIYEYYYKYMRVDSYVEHKSPLSWEIWDQINSMMSQALPIDKDRYIDFIWANWTYQKINYPYLFRLKSFWDDFWFDDVKTSLDSFLAKTSSEINSSISSSNPSLLSWKDLEIYNYLKTWEFPLANVDLVNFIKSKALKTHSLNWETKTLSYYDTLVFSLYWNNLNSVSAKYKFIFENYLNDQFSNWENFLLPKNKKVYEISYLWAPWNAQNMFVKLDPKDNSDVAYPDIFSSNQLLSTNLLWSNLSWSEQTFKCAPPEWVPIWEWIPAITCWIKNMLPPKISISDGECWYSLLSEEDRYEINSCSWDFDKNWISDCIENKIEWGSLVIKSDKQKYSYNTTWTIKASVFDNESNKVNFDSSSYVDFKLLKIEAPIDEDLDFSWTNRKVVYNSDSLNEESLDQASKYINFKDLSIRTNSWEANYSFSSKSKDVDVYISATLNLKDWEWNIKKSLDSNEILISIRWDSLFINSSKIINNDWNLEIDSFSNTIKASNNFNVFLIDSNKSDLESTYNIINNFSSSKEKLVLNLLNLSKDLNPLDVSYPLVLNLYKDDEQVIETFTISDWDTNSFKALFWLDETWDYKIEIIDNDWYKTTSNIYVVPSDPNSLEVNLWTNVIEKWWNISTHLVNILDSYWNVVSWIPYKLDIDINWDSIVFEENSDKSISYSLLEWYRAFRLKSTDNAWISNLSFKLRDLDWNTIIQTTKSLTSLEKINLSLTNIDTDIKVWWWTYTMWLELRDNNWNLLNNFTSRAYLVINEIYWRPETSYVNVENWKANINFITSNVAWKDIDFEIQVEWLNDIVKQKISIMPEKPIKLDLSLSKTKMEASLSEYSILNVELKDRYWNLAFDDNSTKFNISTLDDYKNIIKFWSDLETSKWWKAQFKIYWTTTPWSAFFKVWTNPPLSDNSYDIVWQSPFEKDKLKSILWMLDSSWNLSDNWKQIFETFGDDKFRFKYFDLNSLEDSDVFSSLAAIIKTKLRNLWEETNKMTIYGVAYNAWKIETFYFWNTDSISWKKYNSLYTTLLWAEYWDVTQEWYLAWELLFDKNNRSISVTSLLNNPSKYSDIIWITKEGNLNMIYNWSDLSQDIDAQVSFSDNKLSLNLFNSALSTYIWKVYYNFWNDNEIKVCPWETNDFNDCNISESKTSILLKSSSELYRVEQNENKVSFKTNFWKEILNIYYDWKVERKWSIDIEFLKNENKYPVFKISSWNQTVWYMWFNFVWWEVSVSRDDLVVKNKLDVLKNSIIVHISSNMYWTRSIDWEDTIKMIYYNDPFSDKFSLDIFSGENFYAYERFFEEAWLWWKDWNKSLLEFSSWNSVWESTKNYASFSLINLWDPVLSLKKIKKKLPWTEIDRQFDSTIWKRLSNDDDIEDYKTFDYNNDSRDDILLVKYDWNIKLLENSWHSKSFLDRWNLAYISDLWSREFVLSWDFSWDWYDDIFFVNDKWKPFLLNNFQKDFLRMDLENQFKLDWNIIRAKKYDMDNDSVDDIVTLDDNGDINIFYWWWRANLPIFAKNTIWTWYWIKLNDGDFNFWWAIYYDSLYQLWDLGDLSDLSINTQDLLSNFEEEEWLSSQWDLQDDLINRLLFVNLEYNPNQEDQEEYNPRDYVISSLPSFPSSEISSSISSSNKALEWFIDSYSSYINYDVPTKQVYTTFIKNEYSWWLGIDINKKFTDKNGWFIKSWDIVNVEVEIKNNSTKKLDKVAYVEKIEDLFSLEYDSIIVDWREDIVYKKSPSLYDFMIDSFSIDPGDSITLKYTLKTRPIKYWYLQVWLFEEWEAWDDLYWDVIVKQDNKNCSQDVLIYRSLSKRSYSKWEKEPFCDASNLTLPWNLEQNKIDNNWNGVPDYIDELTRNPEENTDAISEYALEQLENLNRDSDWDGIPDRDDNTPNYNWESNDLINSLESLSSKVDDISEDIDFILDWLWCWFWWWACLSLPLNWAPLAPWSAPAVFWFPLYPLIPFTWIPTFSAMTFCPPFAYTWPPCPIWAWWYFGYAPWPIRIFVTPTLTWWVWTAICYWDNLWVWFTPPPWLHPLIPAWWCIVAAAPLIWCSWDWSDWDIRSTWFAQNIWDWFSIFNWNCDSIDNRNKNIWYKRYFENDLVRDYVNYKNTWTKSPSLEDRFKDAFSRIAKPEQNLSIPNRPLVSLNEEWTPWEGVGELDIDLDLSSFKEWNFSDVIKIQQSRISAFPDFLMEWVTRQIEEIVNKLTDFPTLFVILPDFSWVLDSWWWNFVWNLEWAYNEWKLNYENKEDLVNNKVKSLETKKSTLDCNWDDKNTCAAIDSNIKALNKTTNLWYLEDIPSAWNLYDNAGSKISWIKEAYNFLSNVPMVSIEQEEVNISIPWIDKITVDKAIADWKETLWQWEDEIQRASESWSLWEVCSFTEPEKQAECEDKNALASKFSLESSRLLNSIEQNIEVLEDYKKLPEKIMKLINIKEIWLEQILCNIDSLATLMWERITKNWKRFKAWVELYILIKAILKSWQLIFDIFQEYDSCHQCKNERYDLMYFIWKLISLIIPKIPVIQFPKWPDIILDLHNVRLGLVISLPDFNFVPRPIVLPNLPNLYLPDLPSLNLSLPKIPVLPKLEIPDLPLLPSIPKIELPDLPPPPTIPKIFSSLEAILDIIALVVKIMCFLRPGLFIPEWRAWDHIAFITERQWYLPFDFLDLSLPQFSFPFVDAIEVKTHVNLEFETDFITELARQSLMPLNNFTNNVVNTFDINLSDIDLRDKVPNEINVDINKNWEIDSNLINQETEIQKVWALAYFLYKKYVDMINYINENKDEKVSSEDFLTLINEDLSSESFIKNPKTKDIISLWNDVKNYNYSKEDKFIDELKLNNEGKFNTIKNIINEEIIKNKQLKSNIDEIYNLDLFKNTSLANESNIDSYNTKLDKYNSSFVESTINLLNPNLDQKLALENIWNKLNSDIKNQAQELKENIIENSSLYAKDLSKLENFPTQTQAEFPSENLFASNQNNYNTSSDLNQCQQAANSEYRYTYKWLYIVERWISYRLFDYISEITWEEETTIIDYDLDWDEDILYMVAWELFLKENLKEESDKVYISSPPLTIKSIDNKFYNSSIFYESVNNLEESYVWNWFINVSFNSSNNDEINNYRLEFYDIVDKFSNINNSDYIPENSKKNIIDAFSSIDFINIYNEKISEEEKFILRDNLAYINYVWNVPWARLETKSLVNIKDSSESWNVVNISAATKIYSWNDAFRLRYYFENDDINADPRGIFVPKNKNIEFKESIRVVSVEGDAYVEWVNNVVLNWQSIRNYLGLPIFPWTKIDYLENELSVNSLNESSHIDIEYYDWSYIWIDFRDIDSYKLYDLWPKQENHIISVDMKNDFYYAKIRSFKDELFSTYSKQILLSPQLESDSYAPEIILRNPVRIPVYQSKRIDFTPYIYEDSWIKNIDDFYIDFDLDKDSDGDWNNKNDDDGFIVTKTPSKITVDFWPYDYLDSKKIWIIAIDKNGNTWYSEVDFEIYSPDPKINNYNDDNSIIEWAINEWLLWEPINIYRFRAGVLKPLVDSDWKQKVLTVDWSYNFKIDNTKEWLELTNSWSVVAIIDENTWVIDLKAPLTSVYVNSSNSALNTSVYPEIIVSYNWKDIYKQYLNILDVKDIEIVDSINEQSENGIYLKLFNQSDYSFFSIPDDVDYNGWSLSIYKISDTSKTPIFTIFKDWRVNTQNELYRLEYSNWSNYIILKLYDVEAWAYVWELMFKLGSSFVFD